MAQVDTGILKRLELINDKRNATGNWIDISGGKKTWHPFSIVQGNKITMASERIVGLHDDSTTSWIIDIIDIIALSLIVFCNFQSSDEHFGGNNAAHPSHQATLLSSPMTIMAQQSFF